MDAQLLGPIVTAIVGTTGAVIAVSAIVVNRWAARMRATLDLIERLEKDEYYQKRYRAFRSVRREPGGMERIIGLAPGPERTERDECLDYLNVYEIVALGIEQGILSEQFFRRTYEPTVVRDWRAALPLVLSLREGPTSDPSHYDALEKLIIRWDPSLSVAAYRRTATRDSGSAA